jgi:hypothetical protein
LGEGAARRPLLGCPIGGLSRQEAGRDSDGLILGVRGGGGAGCAILFRGRQPLAQGERRRGAGRAAEGACGKPGVGRSASKLPLGRGLGPGPGAGGCGREARPPARAMTGPDCNSGAAAAQQRRSSGAAAAQQRRSSGALGGACGGRCMWWAICVMAQPEWEYPRGLGQGAAAATKSWRQRSVRPVVKGGAVAPRGRAPGGCGAGRAAPLAASR